mmetsp:Transcript_9119/g.14781  ORF Transcript_9119/g.14781 Transcript_9119/m.14781 type:complete len:364 (+) Transcript_9119:81-1172(+)
MGEHLYENKMGFNLGVVIAVASSLLNSVRPPIQKHVVQHIRHPTLQQSLKGIAQIPIHVIIVLLSRSEFLPTSPIFYLAVTGNAVLNFFAEYFMSYALQLAPLSHTVPFTTLSLPFLVITSATILGEFPSPQGVMGVVLMCGGAFYLNSIKSGKKGVSAAKTVSPRISTRTPGGGGNGNGEDASSEKAKEGLRRRNKVSKVQEEAEEDSAAGCRGERGGAGEEKDSETTDGNVRKGTFFALCVAFCWSLASPIDKVAMRHCTPLQFAMVNTFFKWIINIASLGWYVSTARKEEREKELRIREGAWIYILLGAIAGGVGFCLHVTATNAIPVVYNSALRRCGMIVSVLYGALVFGEHNLGTRFS